MEHDIGLRNRHTTEHMKKKWKQPTAEPNFYVSDALSNKNE